MTRPTLVLACGAYDRTAALADGRCRAEGLDLNVLQLEPEEIFWRMMRHAEFDVAEMSLSSFAVATARGDDRFMGLPVFLSRSFRHSSVYVRADSEVQDPAELRGGRIGVPEYQMTAAVWVRGFFEEDHGLAPEDVTWITGGLEEPGRAERQRIDLPAAIQTERLVETTLTDALLAGDIDALVAPRVPSRFREVSPPMRRVFPDYDRRERDQFRRTGVFPIMHMVVVRSDLVERYPWVPQSLTKAFWEAKDIAVRKIADAPSLRWTLPFLLDSIERQRELMGSDPWPYGLEQNRATLELFLTYMTRQGLLSRTLPPDQLFAPSTHVVSRI